MSIIPPTGEDPPNTGLGACSRVVTAGDVASLGKEEARLIYQNEYLFRPRPDQSHVRSGIRHSAVQHGPGRAIPEDRGVPVDGILGPASRPSTVRFRALQEDGSAADSMVV